ncbi:hypothetical protein Bbelb_017420 [Branchiostoma belcheri]|nr:hypothetical protein Bbelb_017420 [Branchiostoma belcheri]
MIQYDMKQFMPERDVLETHGDQPWHLADFSAFRRRPGTASAGLLQCIDLYIHLLASQEDTWHKYKKAEHIRPHTPRPKSTEPRAFGARLATTALEVPSSSEKNPPNQNPGYGHDGTESILDLDAAYDRALGRSPLDGTFVKRPGISSMSDGDEIMTHVREKTSALRNVTDKSCNDHRCIMYNHVPPRAVTAPLELSTSGRLTCGGGQQKTSVNTIHGTGSKQRQIARQTAAEPELAWISQTTPRFSDREFLCPFRSAPRDYPPPHGRLFVRSFDVDLRLRAEHWSRCDRFLGNFFNRASFGPQICVKRSLERLDTRYWTSVAGTTLPEGGASVASIVPI